MPSRFDIATLLRCCLYARLPLYGWLPYYYDMSHTLKGVGLLAMSAFIRQIFAPYDAPAIAATGLRHGATLLLMPPAFVIITIIDDYI